VAGKSIGKLSIGVDLDAGKAQQGLATLSAEVNALGSAITNMGKNFASSFAAGFGVGSLSQIVSDLGSKLAELVKYTYEFQTKMEAASLRLKDAFSVGFSQDGLKNLMAQTNLEIDELAARLEKLGNLGSGRESAGQIVRGAQIMDPKFGGDGKSQEALIKTLEKLRSQFTASDKDFESFARRGYKVYEQLAQVLGVSADEAQRLAKAGKVGAGDAAAALKGAYIRNAREAAGYTLGSSGGMEGFGVTEKSAAEIAAEVKADQERVTSEVQRQRLVDFAKDAAEKLKTESDRLAEEIAGIAGEIERSAKLSDPKSLESIDTLKKYQESLKDKLADLVNSEWMGQIDKISADFEKQEKERLEKQARIEALLGEGLGQYEQFVRKNAETMKRFDGMAEKLDGDQRLAVLRAKDRALKQANDQADEQFMDANQKLANRMAELQESMKNAQAAGDMAGVNRFQAALGIEAKKIAALGTFQQGSNLATLNEYGSQEWAQARVRALDTDNRSDADKYKEGLEKLNAINEQTGKDVKRMADAVERLGIPQPVSLGKR
jgi:hypothetical protein